MTGRMSELDYEREQEERIDFDESCLDYERMLWLEELAKKRNLTKREEYYYNLYMEGKLCSENTNSYQPGQKDSSSNGPVNDGLTLKKPRSRT